MLAKRWLVALLGALLLTVLPLLARTSYAHAVIVRSEPAANAQLTASPHEVRLWFTEPLEPDFSRIELRDATGQVVNTPPSYVEPTDDHQLVLMVGTLPDGLYTVSWRDVSAADGHGVGGSFAFTINAVEKATPATGTNVVDLTPFDLLARWVNFWALALAVGSIAFIVFVWQPTMREVTPTAPRPLWVLVWFGWWAAGIGALLLLLNQMAILLDQPVANVLDAGKIADVVGSTRFGSLWLARMGLWLIMGLLLLFARRSSVMARVATACGLLMLLPVSMFSHAAVSNDVALSIFSDWVHFAMTTLWVGGLIQFLVVTPVMRKLVQPVAPKLGIIVANFSNLARVTVAGLIVTGIYATWNQVSTLEALTTTLYGRLLILKLELALILLAIAGINLVWTQRRLLAGQALWVGRLRTLVSLEVALTLGILLCVGAMTAINPARNEIAQREAAAFIPPAPEPQPIHMTGDVDDLQVHFSVAPGWVGNSTFTVQLVNEDGAPITDASLIRLRFEDQSEKLGESELQIHPEGDVADGVYSIEGANLSAVGDWRVRMIIQRPDEFDSVTDFDFHVIAPPPPPPAPVVDSNPVLPYRKVVLLFVGFLAVLCGGFFLARERAHLWRGAGVLASILVLLGLAFVVSGFLG